MGKIHYNQADQALIQHSRHVKLLDAEKKSWKRGVSSRSLCKVTRLLYRSYDSYECSYVSSIRKKGGKIRMPQIEWRTARLRPCKDAWRRLVYSFFFRQPVSSFSAELLSRLTQICTYGTRRIITLPSILLMHVDSFSFFLSFFF